MQVCAHASRSGCGCVSQELLQNLFDKNKMEGADGFYQDDASVGRTSRGSGVGSDYHARGSDYHVAGEQKVVNLVIIGSTQIKRYRAPPPVCAVCGVQLCILRLLHRVGAIANLRGWCWVDCKISTHSRLNVKLPCCRPLCTCVQMRGAQVWRR